ncbi:uncharacterized protein [Typha latifolia]|uniref:uncharacterized protein isoform X2 n=1 Tax=Typha latifolia TaxID=4733 RepID=UPI003C2E4A37
MPLYKRKPFTLLEPPQDLDPHELVFQVRFTKEIFRDYQAYLKKVNLYRRRVWTCKVTGKTNLTYEEALVSEHRAAEKVQQFPKELVAPVLHMVQYSTLNLNNLVNEIYSKLQEDIFEGLELHGKKEQSVSACKILKILDDGETNKYEVGWIDRDKKIIDRSLVKAEYLIRKKPPVSRNALKAFIRESTFQNAPWVVHEKLAKDHRINTEPPAKLMDVFTIRDGYFCSTKLTRRLTRDSDKSSKRRTEIEEEGLEDVNNIRKKLKKDEEKTKEDPMKYPIDDLLVQPAVDDPIFTKRPSLSTDFKVPMDCVGDLVMVWDFCSSFSRLMHLWPFTLTEFENAVCHKESNLVLIMEVHSAILHLLIKDEGEYFMAMQKKRRKSKITLVNWVEYICDFLEMEDRAAFSGHLATIRRGHYGLLDIRIKLGILRELVAEALTTGAIRDKLDDCIEQQQALAATTREVARRTREEQDLNKEERDKKEMNQSSENGKGSLLKSGADKGNHISENGDGKHDISKLKGTSSKMRLVAGSYAEKEKSLSHRKNSMRGHHRGKDKHKEVEEKKSEEGQKQHFEREIEKLSIRTSSLGKDRDYNRYWFFRHEGRLFVESSDSKQWGYYTTAEELNALLSSLNPKGERERALKRQLEKFYNRISAALHKRSKDAQRDLLEEAVLRRSTRVRAQPRVNPAMAFLKYVNKWKEN